MVDSILISVIVPVYNVEEYIDECIISILQQTYKNIEIILVDDGSTDRSGILCDGYKAKDKRVYVIHQENMGLAAARNTGIQQAKGEYLAFVDSDDFISPLMYDTLYNEITKEHADIAICNFSKFITGKYDIYANSIYSKVIYNRGEILDNLYTPLHVQTVVAWNKLYKRNMFQTIRYPIGKYHEDEWIVTDLMQNAGKVVYISAPLYCYRIRNTGIMHSEQFDVRRLDILDAIKIQMEYFKERDRVKYLYLYERLLDKIRSFYQCARKDGYNDILPALYNEYKNYYLKKVMKMKGIRQRCLAYIFYLKPEAYCMFMNLIELRRGKCRD